MVQLFQVNKFMITVKPIKAALSREGVGGLLSLGGSSGLQFFKFNDYHHTTSMFNANM